LSRTTTIIYLYNEQGLTGIEGVVSFFAKTTLIEHYKDSFGAKVLFGNQMLIDEIAAEKLIIKYFKQ
jgi:hypothetical protein